MSEPKFTPGPWYAAQPEECGGWWIVATDPEGCDCIDSGDGGFEREDAHLIAAAPELYEALETCLLYGAMTGDEWVTAKAEAALAKARGENT